jgi:hypothetical protein
MDANTALINDQLAEWDEPPICDICDEFDCDCAEEAANEKADNELMRKWEDDQWASPPTTQCRQGARQ